MEGRERQKPKDSIEKKLREIYLSNQRKKETRDQQVEFLGRRGREVHEKT